MHEIQLKVEYIEYQTRDTNIDYNRGKSNKQSDPYTYHDHRHNNWPPSLWVEMTCSIWNCMTITHINTAFYRGEVCDGRTL
jgi:hypothetical protein